MFPNIKGQIQMRIQVDNSRFSAPLHQALATEWRLTLQADPADSGQPYGLTFEGKEGRTETLSIDPAKGAAAWLDATGRIRNELTGLPELQKQVIIEIARKGDLVDVCVNQRRTMIHRLQTANPEVSLFTRGSKVKGAASRLILPQ
jgi:hypothetical protein